MTENSKRTITFTVKCDTKKFHEEMKRASEMLPQSVRKMAQEFDRNQSKIMNSDYWKTAFEHFEKRRRF